MFFFYIFLEVNIYFMLSVHGINVLNMVTHSTRPVVFGQLFCEKFSMTIDSHTYNVRM